MKEIRKTVRLTYEEIPEILQNPILFFNYEEIRSKIENLSPLGVGLFIYNSYMIDKGDIFYLKYLSLEVDIKCICVFKDTGADGINIGAYFTNTDDQKIILKYLNVKIDS